MVLLPGEIQELRVFEPRYRQMLDDCLLDELNFGLVLNDPFRPSNHWDGPRTHGCEAEILHHETKGSNHFLKIVGRRRFTVQQVFDPALPPLNHPMVEPSIDQDGIDPDLQTLLELIPEDAEHSKLYISADVEFHEPHDQTSPEQQAELKDMLESVLKRIGSMLNIDSGMLEQWVEEQVEHVIDEDQNAVFAVAALLVNELEARQQILSSVDIDEAIAELSLHLDVSLEEE
tara:strand:- start:3886 stop:4578 length:693 start_codon:yes stop_codon:yes gene_type:complete